VSILCCQRTEERVEWRKVMMSSSIDAGREGG
jgi:hypothetical protein